MKVWYKCPICGKNLVKIDDSKHIEGVFVKCKLCKTDVEIKNNSIKELELLNK